MGTPHTCFCFLFLPQSQLLFMDLFAAHELVDRRIFVLIEQHQLEPLLIHDSDHICTVHCAQVLSRFTYHLYMLLRDLTANGADRGAAMRILFFLRCRSLVCVFLHSGGEWRPSPGGSSDVRSVTGYGKSWCRGPVARAAAARSPHCSA